LKVLGNGHLFHFPGTFFLDTVRNLYKKVIGRTFHFGNNAFYGKSAIVVVKNIRCPILGRFGDFAMAQDQTWSFQDAIAFAPTQVSDFSGTELIYSYRELLVAKVGQNALYVGVSPKHSLVGLSRLVWE
tara:strand:- start:345 stop:731 length:387 start_codon:yes stop_codon:yes gene_type:complete